MHASELRAAALASSTAAALLAADAAADWGPLGEMVCNRSIWWDYGFIAGAVFLLRFGAGRNGWPAHAVSAAGWVCLGLQMARIYGRHQHCGEDGSIAAAVMVGAGLAAATWLAFALCLRLLAYWVERPIRKKPD